jgi:hypothetical protein
MAHRSQYSVGRPLMACAIFLCAFLQVLPVSSLTDAPFGSQSNALVWASEPYAKGTHTLSNGKVSYKTETVSSFVSGLFSPLLAASEAPASVFFEDEILKQAPPQVVVVAIGQQMREKVHDQTVSPSKTPVSVRTSTGRVKFYLDVTCSQNSYSPATMRWVANFTWASYQ